MEFSVSDVETFTYELYDITDINHLKKKGQYESSFITRGIRTENLELWGYATWEKRSVTFDDNVYLDYWGTNSSIK